MALSSLIYAAWVGFDQGLVSALRRTRDTIRRSSTWQFFQSRILPGIRQAARSVGQLIRRPTPAGALPTSIENAGREPATLPSGQVLLVRELNLEAIRRQNMDDAGCVCWVLRNITDPEALDAAIRLAGTIRWFDGDSDHYPQFDVIVSAFEACFDSTQQLYPGMRDRAYFSARAILQIYVRARTRPHELASEYQIPYQVDHPTLKELREVDSMPWRNAYAPLPFFPLSNILSGLVKEVRHRASTHSQPMIANVLVTWYIRLGGHVDEETFWTFDKSYAVASLFLPPEYLAPHTAIHCKPFSPACLRKWWMLSQMASTPRLSITCSPIW